MPATTDGVGGRDSGSETGTDTVEHVPGTATPWLRESIAAPGSLTFSELHVHPPGDDGLAWIELHNPMVLDMALTGWTLGGGVDFAFDPGTVLPAGGWLVVAADPALLAGETGFAEAVGPFDGRLSHSGERLVLYDNTGRLIDTVAYGFDDPWPVAPDGSGLTLAKVDPVAASDHAEHWSASAELGGTPGAANGLDPLAGSVMVTLIADDATWRYDLTGDDPAVDWAEPDHDDSGWDSGQAPFSAGEAPGDALATAWATADNDFALYLGHADGGALRLVGEESDDDWTTVEEFSLSVTPEDHLYLAAWEAPGDSGSPQMVIAEVALPDEVVGTDGSAFEWVLGPTEHNPGTGPADPAPAASALAAVIDDANADGAWALPAAEADRSSDPWGGAVGGGFSSAARFVWGDTFDSDSDTNVHETYALFRSREPLLLPAGNLPVEAIPITAYFRTDFHLAGDRGVTALTLACVVDDGAVVYLNGVEVLRHNLPDGPIDTTTLASVPVDGDGELFAELDATALVPGENVLAVEVHQAEADDVDLAFGCALRASLRSTADAPTLVLSEVPAASESPFWVELQNLAGDPVDTDGLVLAVADGGEQVLAAGTLSAGELGVVDEVALSVAAGDVLLLYTQDRTRLLDAVRVGEGARARAEGGGPWRSPSATTPGAANAIALHQDVVIHEIQYHRAPLSLEGQPVTARFEEWIELYNRGDEPVDLGGWQLVDAVAYPFPQGTVLGPDALLVVAGDAAAVRAEHPDIAVVGDFDGRLDNGSDRILLLDAAGNPADEVRYFDGGAWPAAADGGGASLELRDPWADNSVAGAWAASDEGDRAAWVDVAYRGVAEPSVVGPDGVWEELVLGLLDAGEVLIDDLSVIQDPDTAPVELLQNGSFDTGADRWRLLGSHRHSEVVPDPEDPTNPVLRLVATGRTGHMHNHAETTLVQPVAAREVAISFRARWVSGSNQLHSRLYFNRLPRTTLVAQPDRSGTPGQPNSTAVDNLGPTLTDLAQDEAVPAPHEPVGISVSVDDPDGVAAVTLWTSVAGATFQDQPMWEVRPGRWEGTLDGQPAGTVVQLHVAAEDDLGAVATLPAAGPDARALIVFDDGEAGTTGLHTLRILMTQADSDWLHDDVNLMSNGTVGATVIYQERQVFYDVGVRAKGSQRGRPQTLRLGYGVTFNDDQPFRGSHGSVLIDRSEGVGYGQREVLQNLVMTHAGSVSGEHNDLIHLVDPRGAVIGPAELQLDRFSDLVLASQFADGDRGRLFEYELIYYPRSTDDGTAEGLKLPQPDSVIGTAITDLGDDPEHYRWNFLIKNNERQDDYAGLIDLCRTFALSGDAFLDQADSVIDVDQWLRAFAFATLSGATDQYGGVGSQHNAQLYQRPDDGRVLFFPHDLDYMGSASQAVIGNADLARLLEEPAHHRAYYGHLLDILTRSYSPDHLAPWCDQLGALMPDQDFASHCRFVGDRADWVLQDSPDAVWVQYPAVDFRITTGGGGDLSVATDAIVLEGLAWVDVANIWREGATEPLMLTWSDRSRWQVSVPLEPGANALVLLATDLGGQVVGSDSLVVTTTAGE